MKIISLGTVIFDDIVEQGLYIEEEHKWLPVGQTVRYALAGNTVISENPRTGRPFTIIAQEDRGWITKATLLQLYTLASQMNVVHELSIINDNSIPEIRNVKFKRTSTPLDLNPIDSVHNYYIGSIHLIQI